MLETHKVTRIWLTLLVSFGGLVVSAQETDWIERSVDGIAYVFPEDYQAINSPEATGVMYSAGNLLLTVTSLADTAGVDPLNDREVRGVYQNTIQSVLRRLGGRLTAAQDTTINKRPAHYSSIEIIYNDTLQSRYDLLQVLKNGKLHGFSCQYVITDELGQSARDRFFNSIDKGAPLSGPTRKHAYTRLFIALGVLAVMIGLILRARRKIKATG